MTEEQKNEQDDLIISRPQKLSSMRKGTEMTATVAGWFVWAVLCRPLFLLFLWVLGIKIFYEHMIRLKGIQGFIDLSVIYFLVIFVLYLLIRSWNSYNKWKFSGKDRRVRSQAVSSEELDNFFQLPSQTIEKMQSWKSMSIHFQSDGQFLPRKTG